jgi:hypothetical protein
MIPMATSDEQVAANLQELILRYHIKQICIYHHTPPKLYDQSGEWSFGPEFIQVGLLSYNLNRLVRYQREESVLSLYF